MAIESTTLRRFALGLLAKRDYSTQALARKLRQRYGSSEALTLFLQEAKAKKWLDDRRFAENFVAYRAMTGIGPGKIFLELRAKGIDAVLAKRAIAAIDETTWLSQIRRLLRKKKSQSVTDLQLRRFLQSRGFSLGMLHKAGLDLYQDFDLLDRDDWDND